jgi:hypothetical protein
MSIIKDKAGFTGIKALLADPEVKGGAGPIRAEWALDWACMFSPRRGSRHEEELVGKPDA